MASEDILSERKVKCSLCPNYFLVLSISGAVKTENVQEVCTFCKRKQLEEELLRSTRECSVAKTCPNSGCGIVIPTPKLLNRHFMRCNFSRYKCGRKKCPFLGTKDELVVHIVSCECYEIPCPHCGYCWPVREIGDHMIQCRELTVCDECGMYVPSSCKTTHDAWLCTARSMWSFCNVCKSVINNHDLIEHRDNCVDPDEKISPIPIEEKQDKTMPRPLPYVADEDLEETDDDEDDNSPTLSHIYRPLNTTSSQEPPSIITHEQLLDSLSEQGEHDVKPIGRTSLGPYIPAVSTTPDTRRKWQKLMETIEEHKEEYREKLDL